MYSNVFYSKYEHSRDNQSVHFSFSLSHFLVLPSVYNFNSNPCVIIWNSLWRVIGYQGGNSVIKYGHKFLDTTPKKKEGLCLIPGNLCRLFQCFDNRI